MVSLPGSVVAIQREVLLGNHMLAGRRSANEQDSLPTHGDFHSQTTRKCHCEERSDEAIPKWEIASRSLHWMKWMCSQWQWDNLLVIDRVLSS